VAVKSITIMFTPCYYLHVMTIHVKKEHEGHWIRCLNYEVEGTRPRVRTKQTCKEVVDSDLKCLHLHASDALGRKNGGKQSQ